ncbi:probable inactive histone-lysine N-methyltransferase SUVR2 isoform X2 [Corylus avellana]|uniref:probable inactive histone-lysine N-methyltransferase SUVR2 isoform X2 n=1 Tax=Corylus avellana TaxID=13451 RepID=UPI00286D43FC|nr:probable inactive histone-lysine N-methyltransferase SUVR2 isoform X2 [Corylus avellana]
MAPNPRVAAAFRAMRDIGIKEDKVKPVLKRLLKLYEKNWELIEEENYRALADAIFEEEDNVVVEQKKKCKSTDEDDLEEEAQTQDEPERPLKRLRRGQGGPGSSSVNACNNSLGGSPLKRPKVEEGEPLDPCLQQRPQEMTEKPQSILKPIAPQHGTVNKGKQPLLPQIASPGKRSMSERASHVCIREPIVEQGIVLLSKQKVPDTHLLIKPKDEPFTDDMLTADVPDYEVPIAVIHPAPPSKVGSSVGNDSVENHGPEIPASQRLAEGNGIDGILASSSERGTNCKLATIPEESPPALEIASSPLGEVKISLSCDSTLGRPDFHMPSRDEVIKLMEDKCLRTYKIIDTNFSVKKLLNDMCECFLELGTYSTDESQEGSINISPTLDVLKESSVQDAGGNELGLCMPSSNGSVNIQCSAEVAEPLSRLPTSLNGLDEHIQASKKIIPNGYAESEHEKELEDPESTNSCCLVVVPQQKNPPSDLRSLHDVNDITKGEERVRISWVNEINSECLPCFKYIPRNLIFQNANVNFTLSRIGDEDCCSACLGDCLSLSTLCHCANTTGGQFAYAKGDLLREEFLEECISMTRDPQRHQHLYCRECPLERLRIDDCLEPCKGHLRRKFIKECWSKCSCSKNCGNRVVQRGISCKLQVFCTPEGKGWGLRTLEDLPKGAFVCEYVGEILTSSELYERNLESNKSGKRTYSVLLDADWGSGALKSEEALCLDATFFGNVARFINHRCLDANLVEIPVKVETPDHTYYHFAFFTTRVVAALEELTWDYGIDFDDHDQPVKAFRCLCGSKFCRNMKRSIRSRSATIAR